MAQEMQDITLTVNSQGIWCMKDIALQLITVELENGKQGVFIGGPLVTDDDTDADCQVDSIWFSDIQDVPDSITLRDLINMVTRQLCNCNSKLQ